MATPIILLTSAKVESVDFHPTKPWILASMDSGIVSIWNYSSQSRVHSLVVIEKPVRTAKFIESQSWIVCGSDDGFIRVYDYNNKWKKVKEFKAHEDFITCLAVHAESPWVLSASGDKHIKLWDWGRDWTRPTVFTGHSEAVMYTAFSPEKEDPNTFASASMDCTVKVWNIDSTDAERNFIVSDSKGINCVNWFRGKLDKEYLTIGCNDGTARVLDAENGVIVETLQRHREKVTAACKHPNLPYLITASADGTVFLWDADTYEFKCPLNCGDHHADNIACKIDYKGAAFGCDKAISIVPNLHPA